MATDPIVIVGAKRTPLCSLLGQLQTATASQLGATAIKGSLQANTIQPNHIDHTIMGCVLMAGQGQAPARQAGRGAGLSDNSGATTINKMCGSGMQALIFAHDTLRAGSAQCMVAGGMESMSNAPYLVNKGRGGYRLGHGQLSDHLFLDGLEDAYEPGKLMGVFAEQTARQYNFSREAQDKFALQSLARAQQAIKQGIFANEIAPHTLSTRQGDMIVDTDEQPLKAKPDKIPLLKPAFAADGTITAANASSISDGAAALVLTHASTAKQHQWRPLAKIVAHGHCALSPDQFPVAPIGAIERCLAHANWKISDIDLFEINEAFAVVTMAAIADLTLSDSQVNIHGGACALGHPIGASGARIVVTLLNALQQTKQKRGIAALCIGGGEATAVAIELC